LRYHFAEEVARLRVVAVLFIICCAAVACADETILKESAEARIRYHRRDEAKAAQVLAEMRAARQDIGNELGIEFREPVEIVLARGREEFADWAGEGVPGWALAIAHTKRRGIVVDVLRTGPLLENNLLLTMRHELCHLALGQVEAKAGARLPLWFHEGVAVRVTGLRHFGNRDLFQISAAHGNLIGLSRLAEKFPDDEPSAQLAYLESEEFVNYLADKRGASLAAIVAGFRKSGDLEEAIRAQTGLSLAELEREWRAVHRSRSPWLVTFWRALSFFSVLAAFTIIAYFIVRRRSRRKKLEWEKEEGLLEREDTMPPLDGGSGRP
jgi:hypothetical protein